jgi:hypothetical protein
LCEAYKYAAYDGLQRWQETSDLIPTPAP